MAANHREPSVGLQAWEEGATGTQQAGHPAVTMATASTGYTDSFHLPQPISKNVPSSDEGTCYTSLTSDEYHGPHQDSDYFTGILQKESVGSSVDNTQFSSVDRSTQEMPMFESRRLFNSDSGIEMTPAESSDVAKMLADSIDEEKLEAYKYIDISRSPDTKPPQPPDIDSDRSSSTDQHLHEGLTKPWLKDQYKDKSEDISFVPYMEEPDTLISKETKSSPVTITLTGAENPLETDFFDIDPYKSDTGLKAGSEVPTVTISEPEDDSSESPTPPSIETDVNKETSNWETQGKHGISEEELINAIKAKEGTNGFHSETHGEQKSPGVYVEKSDYTSKPGLPAVPMPLDNETSSAESGDSEIELVSEDHVASEEAMQSAYMTFSHMGGPPPSPASPSIQYSILREEREAELDSELIIESCDGSSASEESPKRDQDSLMMKPMDIIEEEESSRSESFDGSDYESSSFKERKLNMENLAESAVYLKSSYLADMSSDIPLIKKEEKLVQKKPVESTVYQRKVSEKPSAVVPASVPFLSKKKAIDLLYWRDVKQTVIVFGSVLLMLFSLTQFSVVSVIAYLALAALSATISFRIYKSVLQAVQKTDEGHPFKGYLDVEISLSQEQIQKYTDCLQVYTNSIVKELRRLFLVQDLVDSLKFAVLMWLLTYVGALFNGLTLLIMAVVSMFSLPAVYDKYQTQIDQYLGLVRNNMNTIVAKIQAKIPGTKQKE